MYYDLEDVVRVVNQFAGKKILVGTHKDPDGDAIGSAAAFCYLAETFGCEVKLFLATEVPQCFRWLHLPWCIVASLSDLGEWAPDFLVLTDCGDAKRAGDEIDSFLSDNILPSEGWVHTKSLNIDHHLGTLDFADFNWVDSKKASTGEMVSLILKKLGLEISGYLGEYIYLSIVSDTGNFSFSNTSALTFSIVSDIVKNGLDVGAFSSRLQNTWSYAKMCIWGQLMSRIQLHSDGLIGSVIVPLNLMDQCQAISDDLVGFSSWMGKLKGLQLSMFLKESGEESTKVSLRSFGHFDVREVAANFGGGGHHAAAGFQINRSPEETLELLLEAVAPYYEKILNNKK